MQFDIEFKLTKNEVRTASVISTVNVRSLQLAVAGLFVIVIIQLVTGAIAASLALFAGLAVAIAAMVYASTRMWQESPLLQDVQHIMFSDDTFDHMAQSGESSLRWSNFSKIIESRDFFILHFHQKMSVIVPKRAMTSDQVMTFSRFANQGLYLL